MEYPIILLTGTPGTGKSTLARDMKDLFGCTYINSSQFLRAANMTERDPTGRDTTIIKQDKMTLVINKLLKINKCILLETIYPSLWLVNDLDEHTTVIILLRTHPLELCNRLENSRNWPSGKIIENCLAEAFNEIASELLDYDHSVIEIDTTSKKIKNVEEEIVQAIIEWRTGIKIDWLALDSSLAGYISRWINRLNFDKYRFGY